MNTHAPHFVDAVEGVNASHTRAGHSEFNDRAKLFAEWYGLPVTGGSDSHNTADKWYGGGVMSEKKFASVLDYTKAVAERKVICIGD